MRVPQCHSRTLKSGAVLDGLTYFFVKYGVLLKVIYYNK